MGRKERKALRAAEREELENLRHLCTALELRADRAEAEAEASSRAAQGSDQRAMEARADRAEMQAELERAQEREAVVWPARLQRWQRRLIEAEDRLRGLRGGGAGHWKNRADNATARYESALKRLRHAKARYAELEAAHRLLKRADHSKSVQIGRLTAEVEEAGLRGPEPSPSDPPLDAGACLTDVCACSHQRGYHKVHDGPCSWRDPSLPEGRCACPSFVDRVTQQGKPDRFRVPSEILVRVGRSTGRYTIIGFRQDSEQGLAELDLEWLGPPRHGVT